MRRCLSVLATDQHHLGLACRASFLHEGLHRGPAWGLHGACMLKVAAGKPGRILSQGLGTVRCMWQTAVGARRRDLAQQMLRGVSWVPAGQADVHCGPQLGRCSHRWLHVGVQC